MRHNGHGSAALPKGTARKSRGSMARSPPPVTRGWEWEPVDETANTTTSMYTRPNRTPGGCSKRRRARAHTRECPPRTDAGGSERFFWESARIVSTSLTEELKKETEIQPNANHDDRQVAVTSSSCKCQTLLSLLILMIKMIMMMMILFLFPCLLISATFPSFHFLLLARGSRNQDVCLTLSTSWWLELGVTGSD